MSVTFCCPGSPTKMVPCWFCTEWAKERPDLLNENGRCDDHCTGMVQESEAPECNFANDNAHGVLMALGLGHGVSGDLYGCLEHADIPGVLQKLMVLLNVDAKRSHLIEAASVGDPLALMIAAVNGEMIPVSGDQGARVVNCGNTDEQSVRRFTSVRKLLVYASENGLDVSWG